MPRLININGYKIANKTYTYVVQLGGIDKVLAFYNAGKSFREIRSIGEKTARELTTLCRQFSGKEVIGSDTSNPSEEYQAIIQNLPALLEIYNSEKKQLSKRPFNILNTIEGRYIKRKNIDGYEKLIRFVLSSDFVDMRQRGMGQKSMWEFEQLQNALLEEIVIEVKTSLPIKEERTLTIYLAEIFPGADLEEMKIDGKFSFQRVAWVLFRKFRMSNKVGQVADYLYTNDDKLSYIEIADKVQCSVVTVRNAVKNISENIIPNLVSSISAYNDLILEGISYENPDSHIEISQPETFNFNGQECKVLDSFCELVLATYLKPEYHFLNDLFADEMNQSKVFDCKNTFYFLRDKLYKNGYFFELIKFLEGEIYLFECAEFDYNLKVLIERFYREHNYEYQPQIIKDVYEIIVKIKRPEITVNLADVKRIKRRERKTNLKQIIEDFLCEKGEAQKTADILDELRENDIEIEGPSLLHQLNIWNQTFARLGNGMWGLRSWIKGDEPKGSVREIVEGLLLNRDEPIHVSEILNYFEPFRPITEKSLLTNLWVSENIHFVFFNCSFIGLQINKYSEYWSNIPRFSSAKFKTIYLNKDFDYEEKMRVLERIGYPRIHCEYIISRWNQ
jgi:hypothetical protein